MSFSSLGETAPGFRPGGRPTFWSCPKSRQKRASITTITLLRGLRTGYAAWWRSLPTAVGQLPGEPSGLGPALLNRSAGTNPAKEQGCCCLSVYPSLRNPVASPGSERVGSTGPGEPASQRAPPLILTQRDWCLWTTAAWRRPHACFTCARPAAISRPLPAFARETSHPRR